MYRIGGFSVFHMNCFHRTYFCTFAATNAFFAIDMQLASNSQFVAKRIHQILQGTNRAKEIARLVKENKAEMLVIGAHGHKGLKDLFYGETIDAVRHELKIPVLVINV